MRNTEPSSYRVTVGEPLHNDVNGASAYVVLPATMTFDVKRTKVTQSGAVFTVALRRTSDARSGSRGGSATTTGASGEC